MTSTARGDELAGRTFLSRSVEGRELVAGTEVRLTFDDDGTLGASAGCNQFAGDLSFDGDVLVVTTIGGTEMGCDAERHAQDEWLTSFLTARPAVTVRGDELVLSTDEVVVTFVDRRAAEPDLALAGPRWVVDTILEGDAASSVPSGVEAWVQFTDDGRFEGHDGCNAFSGAYERDAATLRVTSRESEVKACPDLEQLGTAVAAATDGTVRLRIEARRLTLTGDDGAGVSARAG